MHEWSRWLKAAKAAVPHDQGASIWTGRHEVVVRSGCFFVGASVLMLTPSQL